METEHQPLLRIKVDMNQKKIENKLPVQFKNHELFKHNF